MQDGSNNVLVPKLRNQNEIIVTKLSIIYLKIKLQ